MSVACGAWGKNPSVPISDHVSAPTALMSTMECQEPPSSGRIVVAMTTEHATAAQTLDDELAKRGALTPNFGDSCSIFASADARSGGAWSEPPAPPGLSKMAQRLGFEMVLIPVVWSKYTCLIDAVGPGGFRVQTGTARCYEDTLQLLTFLYAADGTLVWRMRRDVVSGSYRLENPGDYAYYADHAESLLESLPLAR